MYFPNIVSSELRRKRTAYYVARKFIDDYIGGVTLAKSIISIFGKQISKKEYVRIASTLQACEQKANTGASFVVDSIEKIKGREGKNCLFILTPDLAAYLFGMSMGITDKRWWERLVSWMMANPNRKLIIYSRADEKYFKRRIPTQVIRVREKVRRDFWKKGRGNQADSVYSDISARLFVVFNSKIFGFPKCSN